MLKLIKLTKLNKLTNLNKAILNQSNPIWSTKPNLTYQTLLDRPSNMYLVAHFVRNHFQHGALFGFYCVTCAKTLKHYNNFGLHNNRVHTIHRGHFCQNCKKSSATKNMEKNHNNHDHETGQFEKMHNLQPFLVKIVNLN